MDTGTPRDDVAAAAASTGAFNPVAFMEDMKRQNEAILESHKQQIETQYQNQMQSFMQQFAPPPSSPTKGNMASQMKSKRPVVSDIEADKQTLQFYANAKQTGRAAPHFEQYEGKSKTHTVRAGAEGGGQNSQIIRMSDTESNHTGESSIKDKRSGQSKKSNESMLHPSLRNNPLSDRVAPAAFQKQQDKKNQQERSDTNLKKKNDSMKNGESNNIINNKDENDSDNNDDDDYGNNDNAGDDYINANNDNEEKQQSSVNSRQFEKFDDATQFMLKKTEFLLNDAKEHSKKLKPKKNRSQKSYKSQQRSGSDDPNSPQANKGPIFFRNTDIDMVEEDEDVNARDGSALGISRESTLPRVQNNNSTMRSVNEDQTVRRNILVKTVNVDDNLPAIHSKVEGKIQETAKSSIHPDYQWDEETRVNNHDYTVDPHLALHKSEWENEIARHILTVYATSRTNKDIKESKSILKYADIDRNETHGGVERYVRSEDGQDSDSQNDSIVEVEGSDEAFNSKQKLKAAKNVGKRQKDNAVVARHPAAEPNSKTAQEAGLNFTRIEKSFRNHSKYRSCLVVRVGRTGKTAGAPHNPGEEISIRGSPRCFPIWFVSSGEIYSNWSKLPGGDILQAQLFNLYEKGRFKEYVGILEKIIDDMWRDRKLGKIEGVEDFLNPRHSTRKRVQLDDNVRLVGKDGRVMDKLKDHKHKAIVKEVEKPQHHTGEGTWADDNPDGNVWDKIASEEKQEEAKAAELSDDDLISLWGQLILTANAFGILCIEKKKYDLALEILQKAEKWCKRTDFLPKPIRIEILPHVLDALAFYFYKRGKNMSAMTYTNLALTEHEELGNLDNICICLLHIGSIQSQGGHFKEAHKTIYQVLAMVEDGRLAFESATPKQLCLVAIAYHNLAVVQLKMMVPDLACKSSQNARKIARLCLSYSNRWLHIFQWTHEVAMEDIKFQLTLKPNIPLNDKQLNVIRELTEDMYTPDEG